jgi:hypothetical protein
MTAIEIGDPRVDTGAVTEAQKSQPAFDPTCLLTFEQVLFVLDRLLECEVSL